MLLMYPEERVAVAIIVNMSSAPGGANVARRDLGRVTLRLISRCLRESIEYALAHRREALEYAMPYARGIGADLVDEFVAMYVNESTLDPGHDGRRAVKELLERGYRAGIITKEPRIEFFEY